MAGSSVLYFFYRKRIKNRNAASEKEKLSEEEIEMKREVQKKQAGWRYQERLQSRLPGLEQASLKWMRAWINQELGA